MEKELKREGGERNGRMKEEEQEQGQRERERERESVCVPLESGRRGSGEREEEEEETLKERATVDYELAGEQSNVDGISSFFSVSQSVT